MEESPVQKIFLSSTFKDLEAYRNAVRIVIERIGLQPVDMRYFGSQPRQWKETALKELEKCDVMIGIYAHRYGTVPDGDEFSITEQEFDHAGICGIHRLCYVVDDKFHGLDEWKETGEQKERLEHFLQKVKRLSSSVFTTPDNLASEVMTDLYNLRARLESARIDQYLAHLAASEPFQDAARVFVSLAGRLLEPSLRLTDENDPSYSSAGTPLRDVREALTIHNKKKIVVLGEPGAGKTTLLRRLALDLKDEYLRNRNAKVPLWVNLAEFVGVGLQPDDFLQSKWNASGLGSLSLGEMRLRGAVCFLLDGINQMPYLDRNARIQQWALWAQELSGDNWAIFTCRSEEYRGSTKLGLPEVHVQSLDIDRIREYFQLRLGEHAEEHLRDFEKRLQVGDDRFERLARNPFMLHQLVERCVEGKSLADNRATLMHDLAMRLLNRELVELRQPEELTRTPAVTLHAVLDALSRLAFAARARGAGTTFTQAAAASVPFDASPFPRDQLIKFAHDASVLEKTTIDKETQTEPAWAFCHELVMEFFAANELLRQFRAGADLARLWQVKWRRGFGDALFKRDEALGPAQTTNWDETTIFAAALAGPKDAARFIAAVQRENLALAGRCAAELPAGILTDDQINALRTELLTREQSDTPYLRARIAAGLALGELGHPDLLPRIFKVGERSVRAIMPPLEPVRAGEFIRGTEPGKSPYLSEFTTERRVHVNDFSIGRYPVTNAEYKFFMDDGGYHDDRWWSDAGREWKKGGPDAHKDAIEDYLRMRSMVQRLSDPARAMAQANIPQPQIEYWIKLAKLSDEEAQARARQTFERPFDRPAFWDDRDLASPGKPVVGVNWYEADAYCRWLSAITGMEFRLPGETEWEKAARGVEGWEYPWGKEFNAQLCNTYESRVGTTTPIGLYLRGKSPFGLFDASGNVWEWTASWYAKYPGGGDSEFYREKFRVVRGGAWNFNRHFARCAFRFRLTPDIFDSNVGFRVFSSRLYS